MPSLTDVLLEPDGDSEFTIHIGNRLLVVAWRVFTFLDARASIALVRTRVTIWAEAWRYARLQVLILRTARALGVDADAGPADTAANATSHQGN